MAEIHGSCDGRFQAVSDVLAASLAAGTDVGASVAVSLDGEFAVDIWGGHRDAERQVPWTADTLTNVWSTTKTMCNLCALVLADRGELDLDAPVARYWPRFAANGKDGVLVRHLLGHTAGLVDWAEPITVEDLYDWEKATDLLAAQAPAWEPGTQAGYHAATQGFLVGEVVRRVTGESIGTWFAKELAGPLGADFHIGLPESEDYRVSLVIPPEASPGEAPPPPLNPRMDASAAWDPRWRRAEIPAAGGHGNARSVATVQAVLACGGEVGGVRLLSAEGCEAVFREQWNGPIGILGVPMRLGMGYGLISPDVPLSPNPRSCFWGGWGGSLVVVDLDARLCFAYMMNKMGGGLTGDFRAFELVMTLYDALADKT